LGVDHAVARERGRLRGSFVKDGPDAAGAPRTFTVELLPRTPI
jgi:hypothetical protein